MTFRRDFLGLCALISLLSACATPDETSSDVRGPLTLTGLETGDGLKAGVPYEAVTPYRAESETKIIVNCFLWSGEGPYCFKTENDAAAGVLRTMLTTRNPGTYRLEGFVKYSADGRELESNRVSRQITVSP